MYKLRIAGNALHIEWDNETLHSLVSHVGEMHRAGVLESVQVLKEKGPDPIKLSVALCSVMDRVFHTVAQHDEGRGGYVVVQRLADEGPALDTVLPA